MFVSWRGTNTYVKSEVDPSFTGWLGTNGYVKAETDPVWAGASNLYYLKVQADARFATGMPVYVESDPVADEPDAAITHREIRPAAMLAHKAHGGLPSV